MKEAVANARAKAQGTLEGTSHSLGDVQSIEADWYGPSIVYPTAGAGGADTGAAAVGTRHGRRCAGATANRSKTISRSSVTISTTSRTWYRAGLPDRVRDHQDPAAGPRRALILSPCSFPAPHSASASRAEEATSAVLLPAKDPARDEHRDRQVRVHHGQSPYFDDALRVSYSQTEIVESVEQIRHPLVREMLRYIGLDSGIDSQRPSRTSPSGTGLGSSAPSPSACCTRSMPTPTGKVPHRGGAGPRGVPARNRPAGRAHRQAGPVRRGLRQARRYHLPRRAGMHRPGDLPRGDQGETAPAADVLLPGRAAGRARGSVEPLQRRRAQDGFAAAQPGAGGCLLGGACTRRTTAGSSTRRTIWGRWRRANSAIWPS